MIKSLINGLMSELKKEDIIEIAKSVNEMLESCDDVIQAPVGINSTKVIGLTDIAFAVRLRKGSEIKLKSGEKYILPFPFDDLSERLLSSSDTFKSIYNSSNIVNLEAIKSYDSFRNAVFMITGDELDCNGTAMKQIIRKLSGVEDVGRSKRLLWEYSPLTRRNREKPKLT